MAFTKEQKLAYYLHYKKSFSEFVKFFCKDYLIVETPEFHQELFSLLPTADRLVLASPRGFAKSHICSIFYPMWCGAFGHKKDICIISASETLATDWLRKIRMELETNPKYAYFWGTLQSPKWTENHIILANGVNIRVRGVGGQIRGFRPDCLILDDIETDESVESEEQTSKIRDWLFKACLNTLLPTGQFIVVGTVLHPLSVLNTLLTTNNGWNKRKFQAYKEGKQEEGHELWPKLWPHKKLQERKAEIGSFRFASEFMNDPVSDETAPIKQEYIREWKELPTQYSCVIAVDPAYSDDEQADYKVAVLVALDHNMNRYLVHYIRTHAPLGEFQEAVINLWQSNRTTITGLGIPHAGTEKAFYDSFLKKCDERKVYPPVVEVKNVFTDPHTNTSRRSKMGRVVAALQPLFEQGKYYIHANHFEARDELLLLGSSKNDDLVDAMSYAEQILQPVFYEQGLNSDGMPDEEPVFKGDTGYGV